MSFNTFDDVREAAAQKFGAIDGISSATKDALGNWSGQVEVKVLPAQYELTGQPNGWTEQYTLTILCSLLMPVPAGKSKQLPLASTLTRAIQVAWRTGTKLGLETVVAKSWIARMEPDPEGAYAEEPCLEWTVTLMVDIDETLTAIRTS